MFIFNCGFDSKLTSEEKHLLRSWQYKGFKGTVVNRALPSLPIGSLEITLTVPLKGGVYEKNVMGNIKIST